MRRKFSAICVILALFVIMGVMTSCAKGSETSADVTAGEVAETGADVTAGQSAEAENPTFEQTGARAAITYREAYDKFSAEYSRGHAQYVEYVENEADKLKDEVVRTNGEIKEILKEKYGFITEEIGSDMTYDDYCEEFVAPDDTYYAERMEAAEMAKDGYLGLSFIVTYGGNTAGDCAALWRYVQYYNLLNELLDIKDFLG